jgi:hypothetical protein
MHYVYKKVISGEQAMRIVLPVITEDAETLKQRLQRERDGRKKSRLQMLYRLASGQARPART